jgi:hypothetical protein
MDTSTSPVATTPAAAATRTASSASSAVPYSPQASETAVATMPTKSPWKNPSSNGISFSAGVLYPKTNKSVTKVRRRGTRHKPSVLLTRPNKRKTVDPKSASMALQLSKRIFEPSARQSQQLQNYDASFRPGKRMLGSYQRGSRLPSSEEEEDKRPADSQAEMPQAKRQRKVMFNNDDDAAAAATAEEKTASRGFSTPSQKQLPRKSTPYKIDLAPPSQTSSSSAMGSAASMGSTSTPERSKLPPKPVVDRIVKSPYKGFGSIEDMIPLGEAVQGEFRLKYKFGFRVPTNSLKLPDTKMQYFDQKSPAAATKKKTNSDDSPKSETEESQPQAKRTKQNTYTCSKCGHVNDSSVGECAQCGEKRGWGNLFKK